MGSTNEDGFGLAKKRIDTSAERNELTDNPFANLAKQTGIAPEAAPEPETPKAAAKAPYRVAKSRKGNWPLAIEKRAGGKVVTVVRQIEGDAEALLKELKKRCATGGAVRDDGIEVQGDHRQKIEAFLNE